MSANKPKTSRKRVTRTADQCQRHREATVNRLLAARAKKEPEPYVLETRETSRGQTFMVLVRRHVDCGAD
jgi:hypothetical protein